MAKQGLQAEVNKSILDPRSGLMQTPLMLSIIYYNGSLESQRIIQDLCLRNADVNLPSSQTGYTPVITAIRNLNEKDALDIIIILQSSSNVDLNKCDTNGCSPI